MNRSHLCFISLNFWRGTYSEGLRYIILGSRLFVFLNSWYLFMASLNSCAVIVVFVFSMFVSGVSGIFFSISLNFCVVMYSFSFILMYFGSLLFSCLNFSYLCFMSFRMSVGSVFILFVTSFILLSPFLFFFSKGLYIFMFIFWLRCFL